MFLHTALLTSSSRAVPVFRTALWQGSPEVTQCERIVPSATTSMAYIFCFRQVDLSIWVVIDPHNYGPHTTSATRHGPAGRHGPIRLTMGVTRMLGDVTRHGTVGTLG